MDQARGRVVLFLIITMAPFAVLAPFIGPALDRIQQGRRFVLAGTMLTRGLLCYAMSANVNDSVTLLPAAFGILVLQKAGGVVKASVTPRLLPADLTLVTANARSGLISIATSTAAAGVAAGIQYGGRRGLDAARRHADLPGRDGPRAPPARADRRARRGDGAGAARDPSASPVASRAGPTRPDMPRPTLPLEAGEKPDAAKPHGRWRTLANVGPVVAEAMTVNAVLRAYSGYILFLLAFLLRSVDLGTVFGHAVSHNFALGALALGLSVGSLGLDDPRVLLPRPGAAADHVQRARARAGGDGAVRLVIRPVGGGHRGGAPRSSAPAWPSSAQDSIVRPGDRR